MQELFSGSPAQIGQAHGESLREKIAATLDVYLRQWPIPKADLDKHTNGFVRALDKYAPHLLDEMIGISQGSNLSFGHIVALNCRTELFGLTPLLECTSVGLYDGRATWLAQNWDWLNTLRGLTAVVEVRPQTSPRMLMLIEAGMVGKIGLNEAGIGVGLNFLNSARVARDAIPVHVFNRIVLEQSSFDTAYELAQGLPRAASCNVMLGSPGRVCSIERHEIVDVIEPVEGMVTHTNSYRGQFCERQDLFERELRLLQKKNPSSPRDNIITSLGIGNVIAPVVPEREDIETVHTILMNLENRELYISDGAKNSEFKKYSL